MHHIITLTVCLALATGSRGADADAKFFAHDGPVPTIKVELDKQNIEALRKEPRKYAKCTVRMGDKSWRDVGVHIKGAAGSFRNFDDRPALTLSFDHVIKDQKFLGVLDKIHLNNSVQDGRYTAEIVSGNLGLAMGVPAARGTHALVEIADRKMGLYVVKEGFDSYFLKRHFGTAAGNLYDGGFLQDIDQKLKRTHGTGDLDDGSDLAALAAAAREKALTLRFARVEKLLDTDKFFGMMALEVMSWHWDGYCYHKNNYRVYHDPKSKKLVFFPHGMDQMWGDPNGTIYPGFEGLIARKLMETKEGKEAYKKKLEEAMEKHYKTAEMCKTIDAIVTRLKKALEPIDKNVAKDIENQNNAFKDQIKAREASIRQQLKK